ncbi:MAG TPA: hypothetical protein VHV78_17280 [Gemmatimonadaceae bacterium]|nr:hypothetical protein [Gemmatimonadaceae bacterium]
MIRQTLLLAALFVLPAVATAQRGGARTQSTKKDEMFDNASKGPNLRSRDIEDQSPIKLLIDKRKDLKLSDAQVSQLKTAESSAKDQNAPLFRMIDSLVHNMKFTADKPTDDDCLRISNARDGLTHVLAQLQSNYDLSLSEPLATFDADQQTNARELLTKRHDDMERLVKERLGPMP